MGTNRFSLRHSLALSASVAAMGVAHNVSAQTVCGDGSPGPVCTINNSGTRGPVAGTAGTATVVTNSGTITGTPAISQGSAVLLYVDNQTGGKIEGNVQGTASLFTGVVNAGEIDGSVIVNDTGPKIFTGLGIYYIDEGGAVDSVQLGTTGYTTANYIQRTAQPSTDTINAGNGLDIYTRSYSSTQTVEMGKFALPNTFEIEGFEVRGSGTTLTLTGAGETISLMGNGNVVNDGHIGMLDTTGIYPIEVTPAAVSYYQTQAAVYRREQIPLGQPQSFYTIPFGDALASFTNTKNGVIDGDIRISTANFINDGEINLVSKGPGTLIRGAKDTDFTFTNNGSIVMTANGPRPASTQIEGEFEHGTDGAVRLSTAINSTQLNNVTIENGENGLISGGLAFSGVASNFTFTNDGEIEIGDNPFEIDRAVSIQLGNFEVAQNATLKQDAVSDSVTITNNGTLDGGIEVEATTRALSFTNSKTGHINADVTDDYAAAVELSTGDWADTVDGPDIHDADTFTVLNAGTIVGTVEIEAEATETTFTNSGSITQALRGGHKVYVNPEASETVRIRQETALDATLDFTNTGTISNADYGSGAVFIELEAGDIDSGAIGAADADATVTVVNKGSIVASGGSYLSFPPAGGLTKGQVGVDYSIALGILADGEGQGSVSIVNGEGALISSQSAGHYWDGKQTVEVPNDGKAGGLAIAVAATDTVTIVNDGRIEGIAGGPLVREDLTIVPVNMDVDFEGVVGGAIDTFGSSKDDVTNSSTGIIKGGIALRSGDDTFTNLGTVDGSIDMGAGNDRIVAGGTITGDINMGTGNDVFITSLSGAASRFGGSIQGGDGLGDTFIFAVNDGGALEEAGGVDLSGFEYVALGGNGTVTSDGTVHGPIQVATGNITLAAGSTFNASFRGDANLVQTLTNEGAINGDVSLGAQNDTFTNRGTLNGDLDLGEGDDTYIHAWDATLTGTADGGNGTDTFVLDLTGSENQAVDLGIYDQLVSFEVLETRGTGGDIDFGDGDTDAENTGTVNNVDLGEGNNKYVNAPGGTINNNVTSGSGNDQVSNQGTVKGSVDLGAGNNEFTNAPGGTIEGNVQSGGGDDQMANQGTIDGAVNLGDGANTFTNAAGGTVAGSVTSGTGNDNLTNQGTITGDVVLDGASAPPIAPPPAPEPEPENNEPVARMATFAAAPAEEGPVSAMVAPAALPTGGDDILTNDKTITGSVYAGAGNDRIINSGKIGGDVDLGEGNDVLELSGAWEIGGKVKGGTGTDTVKVAFGNETTPEANLPLLDLSGFQEIEKFEVASGVGKIGGKATFDEIAVNGGRLIGAPNSVITADINVGKGGTFGSAGTVIGDIAVASGGTLSPGASPAVMNVVGDVSLASGSNTTFEFVPAPGQSDQLLIDGDLAIASGAVLNMTGNRPLTPGVAYDMIVADSITGEFTVGTWDHSKIAGFLRYVDGAGQDRLQLMGTFLPTDGTSPQAIAGIDYVNALLIAGDASPALLDGVPVLLDANGYASAKAFGLISPEPYASAIQLGVEHGLSLAKTMRSGLAAAPQAEAGLYAFAGAIGNWRSLSADSHTGTSRAKSESFGFLGGIGYGSQTGSVAAFVGYIDSNQRIAALDARTDADGLVAGLAGHLSSGSFDLNALIAYDWSKAHTSRAVPDGRVHSSEYDLHSLVLDLKASYTMSLSEGWALQPQVGVTHVANRRGAAVEAGSTAFALEVERRRTSATFVDGALVLRGGQREGAGVKPWLQVGLRHQLEGERAYATGGFFGTDIRFTVPGAPRKETVVTAGAGLSADLSRNVSIFAGYQGEFGGGTGHNVSGGIRIGF